MQEEKMLKIKLHGKKLFISPQKTLLIIIDYYGDSFFCIKEIIFYANLLVDQEPVKNFIQNEKIKQLEISYDEQFMASKSKEEIIKLWNIENKKYTYLQAIFNCQSTETQIVKFPLDSKSFSLNTKNKITKYNLKNYFQQKVYSCHYTEITSFKQLIINNKKLNKMIFSSNDWMNDFNNLSKDIYNFSYSANYLCAAISKDLNYLAYNTNQSPNHISVYLYKEDNQDKHSDDYIYCGSLEEHKGKVLSLAISEDSKFLLSGSNDCTLILWSLKSCSLIAKIDKLSNLANCLAFSPNSFYIAAGLQTGNVELYFQKYIDDQKILEKNKYLIESLNCQDGLGCIKVFSKQSLLKARFSSLERFEINEQGSYLDLLFKQKK